MGDLWDVVSFEKLHFIPSAGREIIGKYQTSSCELTVLPAICCAHTLCTHWVKLVGLEVVQALGLNHL